MEQLHRRCFDFAVQARGCMKEWEGIVQGQLAPLLSSAADCLGRIRILQDASSFGALQSVHLSLVKPLASLPSAAAAAAAADLDRAGADVDRAVADVDRAGDDVDRAGAGVKPSEAASPRTSPRTSHGQSELQRRRNSSRAAGFEGHLGKVPLPRALLGHQVESFEAKLRALHHAMSALGAVSRRLQKASGDFRRLLAALRPQPTAEQRRRRFGVRGSMEEMEGGLSMLAEAAENELHLKRQLLAAFNYHMSEAEAAAIQKVILDEPHLPKTEISSFLALMTADEGD